MKSIYIKHFIYIALTVFICSKAVSQTTLNVDGGAQVVLSGPVEMVVEGGVNLKTNTSVISIITGNLTIRGELQGPGTFSVTPAANLILDGTGNGGINFTPGFNIINNFVLNRIGSTIELNSPLSIKGLLNLQNGVLKTSLINIATLGISGTSSGALSYSTGRIDGPFKRWFTNATNVGITGDFPVGDSATRYNARVEFTSAPSAAGTLTAQWINSDPGAAGLPLTDGTIHLINVSKLGYWRIDPDNGLTGGNYTSSLTATAFLGVKKVSTLRSVKRPTGGGNWFLNGIAGVNTGTIAEAVVVRKNMSGFSEFGIAGAADNPLSISGKISPALANVCIGQNSGTLKLIGCSGTIIRWEQSIDNGALWTPINNSTNTLHYANINVDTWFRVLVKFGLYPAEYSKIGIIHVNPLPVPTITSNTGSFVFCSGTSIILNAGSPYSAYKWSTGATTQTIAATTASTFTVTVTNTSGCKGITNVITHLLNAAPGQPGAIAGPVEGLCQKTGITYSISNVPGATSYLWTVTTGCTINIGQGSNSIIVNFGSFSSATISVKAQNGCGYGPSRVITVFAAHGVPIVINGPGTCCANQHNVAYSISSVFGATSYNWVVPAYATIVSGQGTTSIKVNFAGTSGIVKVKAVNSCGSSNYKEKSVSFNCREDELPVMPSGDDIAVYPNPANESFYLQINSVLSQKCNVRIMDMLGKQMMIDLINLTEGNNQQKYDVSALAKGLYLLTIEREGMPLKTVRIVIE